MRPFHLPLTILPVDLSNVTVACDIRNVTADTLSDLRKLGTPPPLFVLPLPFPLPLNFARRHPNISAIFQESKYVKKDRPMLPWHLLQSSMNGGANGGAGGAVARTE